MAGCVRWRISKVSWRRNYYCSIFSSNPIQLNSSPSQSQDKILYCCFSAIAKTPLPPLAVCSSLFLRERWSVDSVPCAVAAVACDLFLAACELRQRLRSEREASIILCPPAPAARTSLEAGGTRTTLFVLFTFLFINMNLSSSFKLFYVMTMPSFSGAESESESRVRSKRVCHLVVPFHISFSLSTLSKPKPSILHANLLVF